MIGSLEIKVIEELPKVGDRTDYLVQISGPGETKYQKQASITGTLSSVWNLTENEARIDAVEKLVRSIIKVIGTASEPPGDGFWFDTFNAEDTLEETVRTVPNKPNSYIKGKTVSDEMTLYVGGDIMELLDKVGDKFHEIEGKKFLHSLDRAFERSQAVDEMNTPPNDRANYLYRVCILSLVLDRLNFTEHDEQKRSLMGFSSWMREKYGQEFADGVMEPLFMIKRLRRQYPIHEHFEEVEGELLTRQDLVEARTFFDIDNVDFSSDWHKVSQKFKNSFEKFLEKMSSSES